MQDNQNTFTKSDIQESNSAFSDFIELLRDLVFIFILMVILRTFFITPFQINGQSMEPSYHNNGLILVNKFSYLDFSRDMTEYINDPTIGWFARIWQQIPVHVGDPDRGDVVVIKPHVDNKREYYIKRVIAVPGDTIKFEDGKVYIKLSGKDTFTQIQEPYLSTSNRDHTYLPEYVEGNQFLVPDGMYWVMGDNRNNSADSRSCFQTCYGIDAKAHFIKRENVIGKVFMDLGYFRIFGNDWIPDWSNMGLEIPPRFFSSPSTATYPELDKAVTPTSTSGATTTGTTVK